MSHYFFISTGLRGAYMPDNGYVVKVDSKKELKAIVQSEFDSIKDAGYLINQKELVATVSDIWNNLKAIRRSPYSFTIAYGHRGTSGYYRNATANKCFAISISHATESDYLEQEQ